jgi:hypothetical protein
MLMANIFFSAQISLINQKRLIEKSHMINTQKKEQRIEFEPNKNKNG